jgi:hypothetical protein
MPQDVRTTFLMHQPPKYWTPGPADDVMIDRHVLLLAFIFIRAAASAAEPAAPDQRLTPGAIRDIDPAVVCAPGYARLIGRGTTRHRP